MGDRFVAMVPSAGFPRRRGIVHDVSGSGQSLLVEPLEACDDNNRLLELRVTVEEEERRILRQLAEEVRGAAEVLRTIEALLSHLDSLRARARWAAAFGGVVVTPSGERLSLRRARHPVLAMGPNADRLVALDLSLDRDRRVLLVSGPNMGGKTVLLKTVGLAVVMAHAACPVLAGEGTAIPVVERVVADIGDEQSLDRGLSTFAAHLGVLAQMTACAGPDALLLCDELGAGTDPEEGTALGRALIERFATRGAWAIVTSHLGGLKTLAEEVPGVVNGSLEFDRDRMAPRYSFLADVPGASHGLAMAERMGFDREVITRARTLTPASAAATEALIADLQRARDRAEAAHEASELARADSTAAAAALRQAEAESRRKARELRQRLTKESDALLAQARELHRRLEREARRGERDAGARVTAAGEIRSIEGTRVRLDEALAHAAGTESVESAARVGANDVVPGARLKVIDLGVEAEVVSGPDAEGNVTLRRGAWRITSRMDRLVRSAAAGAPDGSRKIQAPAPAVAYEVPEGAPMEVDLRGMEVEEALRALDQSLDRAVLSGLSEVRIIHGVGRGVLRTAVERHLPTHPEVAGQRFGGIGEGGRGVTIARLR